VPDFYQGTELWDFSLVDPDNRRPVDYEVRRELLSRLRTMEGKGVEGLISELSRHPEDGALKMFVISRGLCFRKAKLELLTEGAYWPLRGAGRRQNHLIAFARTFRGQSAICVCGRFFMGLDSGQRTPIGEETWGDSMLLLRHDLEHQAYRDVFSHRIVRTETRNGQRVLKLAEVFGNLPLALLEGL
jgi:(1->4)-alpha-D-glucan 1-alpha-D-glucosylmutase